MQVKIPTVSTQEADNLKVRQSYKKNLEIKQDVLEESDREIHDYILSGLGSLETEDFSYIFGVDNPSHILSEGENVTSNIVAEDFAIVESNTDGRMAIGQIASSNFKGSINKVPRDYVQVNSFGEEIKRNPEINPEITGYYIIRSEYERTEIHKRNRLLNRDLDLYGRAEIPVEIYRVEPEEKDIEGALKGFYSSLTHS